MQENRSILKKVVEKTREKFPTKNVITITNTLDLLSFAHITYEKVHQRELTKTEKYFHSMFFDAFEDIEFFHGQLLYQYFEIKDFRKVNATLKRLDGLLDYVEENVEDFQEWLDEKIADEDHHSIRAMAYIMASILCNEDSPAPLNKIVRAFSNCKETEIAAFVKGFKLAKHPALNCIIQSFPKTKLVEDACKDLIRFRSENISHESPITCNQPC